MGIYEMCYTCVQCQPSNTTKPVKTARLRASGKNGKVALIAVCNKLLKQAFAIATKGTIYQADFKSSLLGK